MYMKVNNIGTRQPRMKSHLNNADAHVNASANKHTAVWEMSTLINHTAHCHAHSFYQVNNNGARCGAAANVASDVNVTAVHKEYNPWQLCTNVSIDDFTFRIDFFLFPPDNSSVSLHEKVKHNLVIEEQVNRTGNGYYLLHLLVAGATSP